MSNTPFKHYLIGASSAKQWFKCPKSWLWKNLFPTETNDAMKKGSELHALAADCIANSIECTNEEVIPYVIYCKNLIDSSSYFWVEGGVEIEGGMFGTSIDFACYEYDDKFEVSTLHIIDLKTGFQRVDCVGNEQLLASAAWKVLQDSNNNLYETVDRIMLTIFQYGKAHTWELPWEMFQKEIRERVEPAMQAILDRKPACAGPHCHGCPGAARGCNAFTSVIQASQWGDDQDLLDMAPAFKEAVDYAERNVTKRILAGEPNMRYTLVPGNRPPLKWCDGAVIDDSWYERKLMTPTQVAKVVGEETLVSKKLAFRPEPSLTLKKVNE